jgi:hypothetical protein
VELASQVTTPAGTPAATPARWVAPYREGRSVFAPTVHTLRGRRDVRGWKPIRTVQRVMWLDSKLRIYRDRVYTSRLWWVRCDACLVSYRGAFSLAYTHVDAVASAVRHAAVVHRVTL